MPLLYNPLSKPVTVQAGGNYFEFKPGQIKLIHNDSIARFIITTKSYEGIVGVPDICGEDKNSEESQAFLIEAKKSGIANRIRHLEGIKRNLEVSLARDLEMRNDKTDPLKFAGPEHKAFLKELISYEQLSQSERDADFQEMKKLTETLNSGKSNESNPNSPSDGSKSSS